jgi:hypothetical protein
MEFNWAMNMVAPRGFETLTGMRTPSSFHRTPLNLAWLNSFNIAQTNSTACYMLEAREDKWDYDHYSQQGAGDDEPTLWSAVNRLNLVINGWDISYKTHPGGGASVPTMFAVDTSRGARMAWNNGVTDRNGQQPAAMTWGWGAGIREKYFVDETFRTMSVGPIAATAIQATTYRAGTILYAGPEQFRTGI